MFHANPHVIYERLLGQHNLYHALWGAHLSARQEKQTDKLWAQALAASERAYADYFARRLANIMGVTAVDHRFILPTAYHFSTQELLCLRGLAECERRFWHKQNYSKFAV